MYGESKTLIEKLELFDNVANILGGFRKMNRNKNQSERLGINVHGGNVQIINDAQNSTINQNNYNLSLNEDEILSLIELVQKATPSNISEDDRISLNESLAIIETEVRSPSPKKSFLRNALDTLKAIKGTAEFAASVAALVQFVQAIVVK